MGAAITSEALSAFCHVPEDGVEAAVVQVVACGGGETMLPRNKCADPRAAEYVQ